MKEGVSIIICCYNSSSRIKTTLQHIGNQVINDIPCEIILVDNGSTDNTDNAAMSAWAEIRHNKIVFHIFQEQKQGLAYAREKGLREANFDFLVFCDDDNWLGQNYIQNVYALFKSNPNIAILGGAATAQFKSPASKPVWFDNFYHGYAVGQQSDKNGYVETVYGAGMAVRKSVFEKCVNTITPPILSGRKGKTLVSGEDSELCYRVRLLGYKIYYAQELKFIHYLPDARLTWNYLKKLHAGLSEPDVILDLYRKALRKETVSDLYWLKRALYFLLITVKYGTPYVFRKGFNNEGEIEMIRLHGWLINSKNYLKFNFKLTEVFARIQEIPLND